MRIPPSVIVMSLVTAVPFGLGIRDAIKHKDAFADADDYRTAAEKKRRALEDEYEADLRRERLERAREVEERKQKLDLVYGPKAAQMGSLLEGIVLGANAGSFQPEHVRRRIENMTRDGFLDVAFDFDEAKLNGVKVTVGDGFEDDEACEALLRKLETAWGEPTRSVWIDAGNRTRARLEMEPCTLWWETYLEPADWVAALPLDAIGKPVDQLTAKLREIDYDDDESVTWRMAGLRYGTGPTKLEAYLAKGRVVGIKAIVDSDFDSRLGVRDAITERVKVKAKQDEDTGVLTWQRRAPIALDAFSTDKFSVLVGKTPWD